MSHGFLTQHWMSEAPGQWPAMWNPWEAQSVVLWHVPEPEGVVQEPPIAREVSGEETWARDGHAAADMQRRKETECILRISNFFFKKTGRVEL